ncbi:MAG: DDE-type integrase/transposase/recombinase [Pseudoclavibacter sp.]
MYAAFVLDVVSRRIVGWQLSTSLHTDLALDALEMGIWTRGRAGRDLSQLIHHSDRGVQYQVVRYTDRLEEAEAVASVGSKGDSYDNAMAEACNSLFKAELVRNHVPWRGINDLEIAVAEYIDWYNRRASTASSTIGHPSRSRSYSSPHERPPSHRWNGSHRDLSQTRG